MTRNGPADPARPAPAAYSRFGQRVGRRYPSEATLLPAGLPDREAMADLCQRLRSNALELPAALRITRQLVLERLLTLDCAGQASLLQVTAAMTALAEFSLDAVCTQAQAALDLQYGEPVGEDGQRARLWVVGLVAYVRRR